MINFKNTLILLLIASFWQCAYAQEKRAMNLASVLQNNMVIQQNKPFKIWGTATAGDTVKIKAGWNDQTICVIADRTNHFTGIVEAPKINPGDFTKYELKVSCGQESTVLRNLLIGEVWLCSGQSNMQFAMKEELSGLAEIANANFPNIRLFSAGLNFSNDPIDSISGTWAECSPVTAKDFSAVAYYFGKQLWKDLHVPIGIIFTGIGASSAQAYVPREILAANPLLDSVYLQPYLTSPKSKEEMNSGFSFEKVMRPFLLYNAVINPFKHFSIKGFCWYQGEANHMERKNYTLLTQALIQSWRQKFAQGNLPFYYVQIAPFFHDKEDPDLAFDAFFREAQEKVSELNNTEMVVTMDVGEAKNLHPKNKRPIGQRLAYTALNRTYGLLNVAYLGPRYDYAVYHAGKVIVHFQPATIGSGLRTRDGGKPNFFYLAGSDKKFYPANADIVGESILLKSAKVNHPVAVRYAFTNYPVTNLENGDAFPAVPFRTDTWEER